MGAVVQIFGVGVEALIYLVEDDAVPEAGVVGGRAVASKGIGQEAGGEVAEVGGGVAPAGVAPIEDGGELVVVDKDVFGVEIHVGEGQRGGGKERDLADEMGVGSVGVVGENGVGCDDPGGVEGVGRIRDGWDLVELTELGAEGEEERARVVEVDAVGEAFAGGAVEDGVFGGDDLVRGVVEMGTGGADAGGKGGGCGYGFGEEVGEVFGVFGDADDEGWAEPDFVGDTFLGGAADALRAEVVVAQDRLDHGARGQFLGGLHTADGDEVVVSEGLAFADVEGGTGVGERVVDVGIVEIDEAEPRDCDVTGYGGLAEFFPSQVVPVSNCGLDRHD